MIKYQDIYSTAMEICISLITKISRVELFTIIIWLDLSVHVHRSMCHYFQKIDWEDVNFNMRKSTKVLVLDVRCLDWSLDNEAHNVQDNINNNIYIYIVSGVRMMLLVIKDLLNNLTMPLPTNRIKIIINAIILDAMYVERAWLHLE